MWVSLWVRYLGRVRIQEQLLDGLCVQGQLLGDLYWGGGALLPLLSISKCPWPGPTSDHPQTLFGRLVFILG